MYKRLTVVQLKELCCERGIDHDLRYKRDLIHALEQYDTLNNDVNDVDNRSEDSVAVAQDDVAEQSQQDVGDGGV